MNLTLYAPAKINLYLRVLGRRPDGYHDIETIFERVSLCDRIILRSLKDNRTIITSDHPDVPTDRKSLISRTAEAVKSACGISRGAEIRIFKKIPVAAGLGGGSSDAASVMLGLVRLWRLSLKPDTLMRIAGNLGSDIPFFVSRARFALGQGRGERIRPLSWKIRLWHIIVTKPVKVLSGDIYKMTGKGDSSDLTMKGVINKILSPRRKPEFGDIAGMLANDLEKAVFSKEPGVNKLSKALEGAGVANSLVSGSGPSVFGLFKKRKEALEARELLIRRFPRVRGRGWRIFIVSTL